ncbi:MAG: acyl-CoA dehydrogenase family protein [Dehalococcoidia bacterium]|nr:acyl-CoA dehydrogenase family protein [Dehalococcoidia bacterium]
MDDHLLTEDQRAMRKMMRDFVEKEIAPKAAHLDETSEFPWENFRKLAELGVTGMKIPEKYGGMGAGMVVATIVLSEIARGCASTGGTLLLHTGGGADSITMFGSDYLKDRYLPLLASGEKLACFAVSEPDAGSDPSAMRSTARLDGDHYVLNGVKCWTTNGIEADVYVVAAKTRPEAGNKGISCFVVEKGAPGFTFGKREEKMGLKASSTATEYFDNCPVPKENLVGIENNGFKQIVLALNKERLGNCSLCFGLASIALEKAVGYSKERVAFGSPIANFQGIRWMLAEMATNLRAAGLLIHSAAQRVDSGVPAHIEISMAKLFTNEAALKITSDALQIFGGNGYTREYPLERYMRDVRGFLIGGGTTQIQRQIIGSSLVSA